MSDAPTSPTGPAAPDDEAAIGGTRTSPGAATDVTPGEAAAIRAFTERSPGDVAGFEMREHERWGALREGATGDLYSVIDAYKRLEGDDDREPGGRAGPQAATEPATGRTDTAAVPSTTPSPAPDDDERRGRPST